MFFSILKKSKNNPLSVFLSETTVTILTDKWMKITQPKLRAIVSFEGMKFCFKQNLKSENMKNVF